MRDLLGVTERQLTGDDYTVTHAIGRAALRLGYAGIMAPSARTQGSTGYNLVVFGEAGIELGAGRPQAWSFPTSEHAKAQGW